MSRDPTVVSPPVSPSTHPADEALLAGNRGWRVALAAAVGVFFAATVVVTFPLFLKPWSEEFGWSRQSIATAFAIAALVAGVSAAPLGALVDRVGPRRVAVPCLVLLGLLFGSLSRLGPRPPLLDLTYAALGIAAIGTSPVAYARAVSTWFDARRGMALAVVITGGALAGIALPPAAGALIQRFGWRGACLVLGATIVAIGAPVVAGFVRERPAPRGARAAAPGAAVGQGLRTPVFWMLAAVIFCGTMTQNSVLAHLAALLTDRGIGAQQATLALSAMALSAVAGRLVTGAWIDRAFAGRVLVLMMALASAGAFLLSGAHSLALGVLAAMLVGFGTGGEADVIPYLVSRYFGLRSFSTLFGLLWLANAVGGALGPVLMGRAFDASGSYASFLVRLGFVAAAAAGLALLLPRFASAAGVGEVVAADQLSQKMN